MLTVPLTLNSQELQSAFIDFRDTVLNDRKLDVYQSNQLTKQNFTFPSMLHLTFLHLDLKDPAKLDEAKKMMKEIEAEFQNTGLLASDGGNLTLNCKGLKTSGYINPSKATALYLDID